MNKYFRSEQRKKDFKGISRLQKRPGLNVRMKIIHIEKIIVKVSDLQGGDEVKDKVPSGFGYYSKYEPIWKNAQLQLKLKLCCAVVKISIQS
jgi:hypothetical protein